MPGPIRQAFTLASFDPDDYHHERDKRRPIASSTTTTTSLSAATETSTLLDPLKADEAKAKTFLLSKASIAWLVVIGVLAISAIVIVSCLLCRCRDRRQTRNRRSDYRHYRPKSEFYSGQNKHDAWNVEVAPIRMEDRSGKSGGRWKHSSKGSKLREPVIVDQAKMVPPPPAYRKDWVSRWNSEVEKSINKVAKIGTGI